MSWSMCRVQGLICGDTFHGKELVMNRGRSTCRLEGGSGTVGDPPASQADRDKWVTGGVGC